MTDTRSEIMDAFAGQLAADGYQGISLIEVARSVGIRKPSIYHHFPGGKEELYTEVSLRFISQLRDHIARALSTSGGLEETLLELGTAVADQTRRTITVEQRIYDALEHVSEPTKEAVSTRYVAEVLDPVVRVFSRAVDRGDLVGDPWFLMNAFLHLVRSVESRDAPDQLRAVVTLFLDGARPR